MPERRPQEEDLLAALHSRQVESFLKVKVQEPVAVEASNIEHLISSVHPSARYMPPLNGHQEGPLEHSSNLESETKASGESYADFAKQITKLTSMAFNGEMDEIADLQASSSNKRVAFNAEMYPLPPPIVRRRR